MKGHTYALYISDTTIAPMSPDSDSETGGAGVPLIESLSPSPEPTSTKRKADDQDRPTSKRAAKRKKNTAGKDDEDDGYDLDAGLNLTIAHMDSQLMADHLAQRTKRFQSDSISLVELEDIRIPGKLPLRAACELSAWLTSTKQQA